MFVLFFVSLLFVPIVTDTERDGKSNISCFQKALLQINKKAIQGQKSECKATFVTEKVFYFFKFFF